MYIFQNWPKVSSIRIMLTIRGQNPTHLAHFPIGFLPMVVKAIVVWAMPGGGVFHKLAYCGAAAAADVLN
jgi:hypothetical protein